MYGVHLPRFDWVFRYMYIGFSQVPVIVTTRIYHIGNSESIFQPSIATIAGKGANPMYIYIVYT